MKTYKEYLKTDHRNYLLRACKDRRIAERRAKWDADNAGKPLIMVKADRKAIRDYKANLSPETLLLSDRKHKRIMAALHYEIVNMRNE